MSSTASGFSAPRELYPAVDAYNTFSLEVGAPLADGSRHTLYVEEAGSPAGKPAIFLHGGPGGGINEKCRQFFDASAFRIVLFDQRGSGKSTPFASLEANTTWDLVADIETIRVKLGIEKWLVFGGSWGSTLAIAYAETHPERVSELVLRGIFLLRRVELEAFYQSGSSWQFPDYWDDYTSAIPEAERGDLISAFHKRIVGDLGEAEQTRACKAWSLWEGRTSKLLPDEGFTAHYGEDKFSLAFARIESHYFVNSGFLDTDAQLLEKVGTIRHIPAVIVQGRYDMVCPAKSAWELHKAWPEAEFKLIPDAGHSAFEPGIQAALLAATDKFRPAA
jgi:proline iminopeptidase